MHAGAPAGASSRAVTSSANTDANPVVGKYEPARIGDGPQHACEILVHPEEALATAVHHHAHVAEAQLQDELGEHDLSEGAGGLDLEDDDA